MTLATGLIVFLWAGLVAEKKSTTIGGERAGFSFPGRSATGEAGQKGRGVTKL